MKRWTVTLAGLAALALVAHVVIAAAEDPGATTGGRRRVGARPGGRPERPEGRPEGAEARRRGPGPRLPISPLMRALDTDKDGKLSAAEIAAAPAALAKLDKNGDGELTRQEIFPRPPRRPEGEEGAAGADKGKGKTARFRGAGKGQRNRFRVERTTGTE